MQVVKNNNVILLITKECIFNSCRLDVAGDLFSDNS